MWTTRDFNNIYLKLSGQKYLRLTTNIIDNQCNLIFKRFGMNLQRDGWSVHKVYTLQDQTDFHVNIKLK